MCWPCVCGHAKNRRKKNKEIKRKETTIAVGQTEITISQVELLSIDRVPVCNFSLRFVAVVSCLQYSQKICASTRNMHSVQMMGFLMHFFFFFISFSLDTACSCTSKKKLLIFFNIEKKERSKQPTQHILWGTHTAQVSASIYADFSTVSQIAIMKMKRTETERACTFRDKKTKKYRF